MKIKLDMTERLINSLPLPALINNHFIPATKILFIKRSITLHKVLAFFYKEVGSQRIWLFATKLLGQEMPVIEIQTRVNAPIEIVFNLSRNIAVHLESTTATKERVLSSHTSDLLELGDEVTWEATHFGVRQRLTTVINEYRFPIHFRDSMVAGAFHAFDHDHFFEMDQGQVLMTDRFNYTSPLGILGRVADVLFLKRYMKKFLVSRNQIIKSLAESGKVGDYLGDLNLTDRC